MHQLLVKGSYRVSRGQRPGFRLPVTGCMMRESHLIFPTLRIFPSMQEEQ